MGEGLGVPDEDMELPNYEDNLTLKEDVFTQVISVGNSQIVGSISTPLPVILVAMPDNSVMPPIYHNNLAACNANVFVICYSIPLCQNPLQEVKRFVDDIKKTKKKPVIVVLGVLPNDAKLPRKNTVELGISVAKSVKAVTYLELDIFRATADQVKNTFFNICICSDILSKRKQQLETIWKDKMKNIYTSKQLYQPDQIYIPAMDPVFIETLQSQSIYICFGYFLSRRIDGKYSKRKRVELRVMFKQKQMQLTIWTSESYLRSLILNDTVYSLDRLTQKNEMTYYYKGSSNSHIILFTEEKEIISWRNILQLFIIALEQPKPIPIPPPAPPFKRPIEYIIPPEDGSCPINFLPTELLMIFFSQQTIKYATNCRRVCKLWLLILDNKWLKKQIISNSPPPIPQVTTLFRHPYHYFENEDDDLNDEDDWD